MPAVKEEEGDEMGENRGEICHHNVATRVFVEQEGEGWLRIPSARSAPIEKIFLCVSNPRVAHYFIPPLLGGLKMVGRVVCVSPVPTFRGFFTIRPRGLQKLYIHVVHHTNENGTRVLYRDNICGKAKETFTP